MTTKRYGTLHRAVYAALHGGPKTSRQVIEIINGRLKHGITKGEASQILQLHPRVHKAGYVIVDSGRRLTLWERDEYRPPPDQPGEPHTDSLN